MTHGFREERKKKIGKKVSLRLNLQEMPTGSEWEVLFLAIRRSTRGSGERMIDAWLRKRNAGAR